MRKIILPLAFVLAFAFSAFAQEYEYGSPSELKGLKKVFIDTRADLKNRERIVRELAESKLGFEIVAESKEAEILLVFESDFAIVDHKKRSAGKGFVFIQGKTSERLRVVMNFEAVKDLAVEKKPAAKFAARFVKAYKKANGLKN